MKKHAYIFLATMTAALVLWGCKNAFTGTDLDKDEMSAAVASYLSADRTANGGLGATVSLPVALDVATTTTQYVVISFDAPVDSGTIATAVSFYPLDTTAETDGARKRKTALTYTVGEIRKNGASYDVYFAFASLAAASATVEVYINPTILTAKGGTLRLDVDGDNVQGEAQDDDFIDYFNVTGGTAIAGNARNPRVAFPLTGTSTATAAGTTSWTFQFGNFAADTADYKATLDSVLRLEKFNFTTGAWENVTYTSTYTAATGNFVMTFTAFAMGECYRSLAVNLDGGVQTVASINGYRAKLNYDAGVESSLNTSFSIANTDQVVLADANVVVTSSFDGNSQNGYISLVFNAGVIGTEGLDDATVTASNLKIRRVDGAYIPFTITLRKSNALSTNGEDQVILTLDPSYKADGASTFEVLIGPGMKMLGATTATSDDRIFGNVAEYYRLPYGFVVLDSDTSTL